jgi:D-tyrosyl-tRNA(Tyr) deacylase
MRKVAYFFCMDLSLDHVAARVYKSVEKNIDLAKTCIVIDGYPVMEFKTSNGNLIHFVRINDVLSHDYVKYLPVLNEHFQDYDFIGVINWHEGAGGADCIFTAHSTGDVNSGNYGIVNPNHLRAILHAVENNRIKEGMEEFQTLIEATHWSGIVYNQKPEEIINFQVPVYDIEIGSIKTSWENEQAANVLAKSIVEIFNYEKECMSILCIGGMHFTDTYAKAILNTDIPIGLSHIISNFWLEKGEYDTEAGYQKLLNAVKSIKDGIRGIAFHDNMKSAYKNNCRKLSEELGVPAFKKNALIDVVKIKEIFRL